MTLGEEKVIRVATDIAEAGKNIGFDKLPSVMIHELYEAVEQLKRETKMSEPGMDTGASRRYEEDPFKAALAAGGKNALAENLSTDELARRSKFAIAEYARHHREWLRQSTDLEAAKKRVADLEIGLASARLRLVQLVGSPAYLDFLEALHWRYVEYPHES